MKKIGFKVFIIGLFLLDCIGENNSNGISAQSLPENRWLIGTWIGDNFWEIFLNDNGTGNFRRLLPVFGSGSGQPGLEIIDIIYSINGNILCIYDNKGSRILYNFTIHRINDQRMIIERSENDVINFNKRNYPMMPN